MKCFLFDIGNVLVDFEFVKQLEGIAAGCGKPVEWPTERDEEMQDAVERGRIDDAAFVAYLNEAKGLSWQVDDLVAIWRGTYTRNAVGWGLLQDAVRADIPVYLLSNLAHHHTRALEGNWSGFFDDVTGRFFSYELGCSKPDPEIYRQVLDRLGARGEQCFFIDDMAENVEAARAEGIEAHQFIPENHVAIREAVVEFFELS